MRPRLDQFNSLPPKPEHIQKVRAALRLSNLPIKLAELTVQTGLTNTQVLCALNLMMREQEIIKLSGSNTFQRIIPEAKEGENYDCS